MVTRAECCLLSLECIGAFISLTHDSVLSPLQNFKTYPKKSLLLIQPMHIRLQTQKFSIDAGNAGTERFVFPTKCHFEMILRGKQPA